MAAPRPELPSDAPLPAVTDLLRQIEQGSETCRLRAETLRRRRASMSPVERAVGREEMRAEAAALMSRLARLQLAADVAGAYLGHTDAETLRPARARPPPADAGEA
jgi:predicted phage gp36 major capsid-like protein